MKIFGTKRNGAHYAKKRRRGLRVFLILCIIAVTVTGGVYAWVTINVRPPVVPVFEPPRSHPTSPTDNSENPAPTLPPERFDREIYTILVLGQDNVGEVGLTDTVMLVAVDTANGRVNVLSIPRDTLVDVSWTVRKINSVMPMTRGDVNRVMEEVEKLTGFRPDNYVVLGLQALEDLVNVLDGVEFYVPVRMVHDDPYQTPPVHINLQQGLQTLNGNQAQQVVRFRGYPNGDIGRIETQQAFLRAVAAELLQIRNIPRIHELVGIFIEHVDTDIPLGTLIWYATELMGVDSEDLNFFTMPSTEAVVEGIGYIVVEIDPWLELINHYFNPYPVPVQEENVRLFTRRDGTVRLVGEGNFLTP
ncbi:MAG: LCP family protein [Oscillospiraceae bacterium]|nr:LCP family protein [Oscillospiraceae bacterium]